MYAKTFFETYNFDAVTLAPYMGLDTVSPFLEYEGKWSVVLALTSNKSAADFQYLTDKDKNEALYETVLKTGQKWGNTSRIMFVVGATKAGSLTKVREIAPDSFLLVPGVGAQGGSLGEVAKYGMNDHCGLLVNSSRGIIYASSEEGFADVAKQKSEELQKEMQVYLTNSKLI
jgi:orotidine-5'-phosphate decarboxylase